MIIADANEIEVMSGGRVHFSIGGGSSTFQLRHDQEIVIRVTSSGLLQAEVKQSSCVFV